MLVSGIAQSGQNLALSPLANMQIDEVTGYFIRNNTYFLPLFDRPKINIVFSNTLKARSCIAKQVHNSKTIL